MEIYFFSVFPTENTYNMENTTTPKPLLSRTAIAEQIGRSPTSVILALKREKIEPEFQTGKFAYYNPDVIPKLESIMRAKNYNKRFSTA